MRQCYILSELNWNREWQKAREARTTTICIQNSWNEIAYIIPAGLCHLDLQ